MVVRFTAGPADESDAGQQELAPVISFSASRRAQRGETQRGDAQRVESQGGERQRGEERRGGEHGRARGNHPAGSALTPRDGGEDETGADDVFGAVSGVHSIGTSSPETPSRDSRSGGASGRRGAAEPVGLIGHSGPGSALSGSAASGSADIGRPAAPVASLARKRVGAAVSVADDEFVDEVPPSIEDVENAILKKLRRRGLSEAEILAECLALDLTAHQANELLERLRELGYVDDRALAEQLRYSHYERKSQSRQVVARLMSTRKIPAEVIDEVLEDIGSDDELSVARDVAEKRASQMTSLDDATMERRLVGFLARRGYPGGVVRTVVGEIIRGRRSSVRFR